VTASLLEVVIAAATVAEPVCAPARVQGRVSPIAHSGLGSWHGLWPSQRLTCGEATVEHEVGNEERPTKPLAALTCKQACASPRPVSSARSTNSARAYAQN